MPTLDNILGAAGSILSTALSSLDINDHPTLNLPPPGVHCFLCARCLTLISYAIDKYERDGREYEQWKVKHSNFKVDKTAACRICWKADFMFDQTRLHRKFNETNQNLPGSRYTWEWQISATSQSVGIRFEALRGSFSASIGSVSIQAGSVEVKRDDRWAQPDLLAPLEVAVNGIYEQTSIDHEASTGPKHELMRRWLRDCLRSHPQCFRRYGQSDPSWYPDRLVAFDLERDCFRIVQKHDPQDQKLLEARMVTPKQGQRWLAYISLSHRWGTTASQNDCMLTLTNIEQWCQRIPWEKLPATHRDAMSSCVKLGFALIWIDSLCIVQDSREDWLYQSATMADVYKNAVVNLAALSTRSDDDGFLLENRDNAGEFGFTAPLAKLLGRDQPGRSPGPLLLQGDARFEWYETAYPPLDYYPLFRRAWVYQERQMSRRTIAFSDRGAFFVCDMGSRAEHQYATGVQVSKMREWQAGELAPAHTRLPSRQRFEVQWSRFVTAYTACELSHESDRLMAISAIAKEMAAQPSFECGRYLAGLWEQDLLSRLAWHTEHGERAPAPKLEGEKGYIAPSWSWASIAVPIHVVDGRNMTNSTTVPLVDIIRVSTNTTTDFQFGAVDSGFIQFRGNLGEVVSLERKTDRSFSWGGYREPLKAVTNSGLRLHFHPDSMESFHLTPHQISRLKWLPLWVSFERGDAAFVRYLILIETERNQVPGLGQTGRPLRVFRRLGTDHNLMEVGLSEEDQRDTSQGSGLRLAKKFVRDERSFVDFVLV